MWRIRKQAYRRDAGTRRGNAESPAGSCEGKFIVGMPCGYVTTSSSLYLPFLLSLSFISLSLPLSLSLSLSFSYPPPAAHRMHWGKSHENISKRWLSISKPKREPSPDFSRIVKKYVCGFMWPRLCVLLCSLDRLIYSSSPGNSGRSPNTPTWGSVSDQVRGWRRDQSWHFWELLGSRDKEQEEAVEIYHKPSFSPGVTRELIHSIVMGKNRNMKKTKIFRGNKVVSAPPPDMTMPIHPFKQKPRNLHF